MDAIPIHHVMLIGGLLVFFAVASSRFSSRLGVPVLVVFIAIGMLAGSEGIGGIEFENYAMANALGTVALALILLDGGLRTSKGALRAAWRPALTLATVGVLSTSLLTGLAAAWILDLEIAVGILIGCIVGSTDAAAVFSILRNRGARLSERLGSTLEVESGSNDPMAVFLTVSLIEILLGRVETGPALVGFFVLQMGVGALAGAAVGLAAARLNARIQLDAPGLHAVMTAAMGFISFGLAATLGGSGFLAVYVAGIFLGNSRIVFRRGIFLFSDGMAWLAQIVMFTMLGLLVFPSRLLDIAPQGIAIAAVLILIARPASVFALLGTTGFNRRELLLLSWVGLRGAVPIILATYPLLANLPQGRVIFDVVFFVVLVSALAQGWTIPTVASRLGLQLAAPPESPITLEIASLRHVAGDIVDYLVLPASRAEGRLVRELALPSGAVIALIARGDDIIPPRGSTRLVAGDHVSIVLRSEVRQLADRVFAPASAEDLPPLAAIEFQVGSRMRVSELAEFYGIHVDTETDMTLAELLQMRLGDDALNVDTRLDLGTLVLRVHEVTDGAVEIVGLELHTGS